MSLLEETLLRNIRSDNFEPHAWYNPGMDSLTYLCEDVCYVSERVDAMLTLLWHPQEKRVVGVRLKGVGRWLNDVAIRGLGG